MIEKEWKLFLDIYINERTFKVIINSGVISNFIDYNIVLNNEFKLIKKV